MNVVGVAGAGLMGAEIALVFALAGKTVFLHDREQALIDRGLERLGALIQKAVDSGRYLPEARTALDRIVAAPDLGAFAGVDMVTEAIFEDEDVKASLWRRLDELCDPRCIFATNTSTIPISTLASKLSADRRRRFVGTHYFSPVSRMALVEVIAGFETEAEVVDATMAIMTSIGKTPIHVKDVAGFAVNRMLHAFIIEAVRLVEEGVATPEDLDTACRLGLGHPIGPFALMDVVTSSLCVQAQEIMQEAYGERFRPPPLLKQRVRAGLAGGKGRPGWLA